MNDIEYQQYQDELCHYGVLGMKWGVRRATKQVKNATTRKTYNKGMQSLNKHRTKSAEQLNKLSRQSERLKAQRHKDITVNKSKAATLAAMAARKRQKANSLFNTEISAYMRRAKADKLDRRATQLNARIERTKAQIVRNAELQKTFKTALKDIDQTIIDYGKRVLED